MVKTPLDALKESNRRIGQTKSLLALLEGLNEERRQQRKRYWIYYGFGK